MAGGRAATTSSIQADLWISPLGSDTLGNGSASTPFASPSKALTIARALQAVVNRTVSIGVRGQAANPTYYLGSTISLVAADKINWISQPGESPVFSGGTLITGAWTQNGSIWSISLPAISDTRLLSVNDVQCRRARSADGSMLSAAVLTPTGYNVSSIALTGYGNPTSIEMVYEGWTHVRVPIASMTSTTITMAAYPWDRAINWAGINNTGVWFTANATPSWIENAYEFLATGSPGDWYFDKTTKILYMRPPAGVTLNSATVVIGNLQQMMVLNGSTGTLVQGIGFADCQWLEPNTNGYAGTCGAYYSTGWITPTVAGVTQDGFPTMPAAVQLIGCNNVRLLGNNFRRVSPNCINVDRGSNNNLISGNNFNAVGGCAITLSDPIYFAPIGGSCQNNVVRDNTIYAPAQEYRSCVGITPFYTDGTQIINNTIINCPYMAIPLGNGGNGGPGNSWAGPSLVRTVTVADNLIQGIMLNLHDGGGIYVREDQRGAAITGNVITGAVQGSSYNLYEDDYGANATFSGNVIVKGSGSYNWFFHNCAATSSVAGNFADQAAYANQSGSGFTPAFSPPDTIISGLSDPRVASIVAAAGAH